jgi:hypothetical protein
MSATSLSQFWPTVHDGRHSTAYWSPGVALRSIELIARW